MGAQEISEMLSGRMTNQDEDEVEDELEALEREMAGVTKLPSAPTMEILPDAPTQVPEDKKKELQRERAKRRAQERAAAGQEQPMLA